MGPFVFRVPAAIATFALWACVGTGPAWGQDQLPTLIKEQAECIQQISEITSRHTTQLADIRLGLAPGATPRLPDMLAEVKPLARTLSQSINKSQSLKASMKGSASPQLQQQVLLQTQELLAAGISYQAALGGLIQECDQWAFRDDLPADSLDGFRTYQTQMRAAMYGMVMPALKSNTDYAKHISRFSNKWLALERKHGAASLLDVHLKGDSSEAALNELTAAMRTMLGPDVEIVAERIERTNSVVLVAAPSLRVEDINAPDIAGEQVTLPHLNVLMIKRNGGQGPPAVDQLAQPPVSAPADPMSGFAESPEAMAARLEAQATQTHNRMLNSNQSVSINFITPHPKGDQGNDWFSPIVDAVRDLLPDGNSGSSFRGAGDGTSSGTVYPVPDFDAFCDALNDHPYFTIEQSSPQTRAISLIVDWSAVKPGRYRDFDSDDWDDDFDDDDFDAEDARAFGGGGVDGNMGRMTSERLAQRGDPDYESKLTELMTTGNTFERDDAAKALLVVEKDGLDKAVRGKVAKAFLQFFRDRDHSNETVAIRGLVKFGGKHATKYLVESIHGSDRDVHTLIYQALAKYPTAEGADAVASRLGERRESGLAAETLIKMGAIAEPSAIRALRTSDEDIALAAIYVLEHVGTEEAMSVLSVARDAGNPEVKEAAVKARTAIRKRRKS